MGAGQTMTSRAWAELALLSVLWGGSFFAIAIALGEMGFLNSVLHRVFWGALILWGVVLWQRIPVPRDAGIWGRLLVMGALNNVIPFSLMAWAQASVIESGLVSIFNAMTAPLGVLVAAMLLRDEPLTRGRGLGVALAFAGAVVIIGPDRLLALDLRAAGQWAVVLGALSYAFASVWAKVHLRGLPPVMAACGMLTGSVLVMLPVTLAVEGQVVVWMSAEAALAIAYYGGLATAGAYLLYYRVLGMAGAGNLMLCTLLIPPIAIFLGWAFLDEWLGAAAFAGFAMIALGLVVIDGRVFRRRGPG